jgi:uncharacterized tellurite resistance protein B-like protein
MNLELARLGYRILMMFATIDGHYDTREGAIMLRYIERQLGDISNFDLDEQNQILLNIPLGKHLEACMQYARDFNTMADEEEKVDLIYHAFEILSSEDEVQEDEKQLFLKVAAIFDIEVEEMLK